jgi:protein TonB
MPQFPGGSGKLQEYIEQNMHYPAKAKAANLQGRVIIAFIVEKDGSISHVKVVKSVDPLLDEEALRIVKSMPKWHPGKQTYLPVRVKIFLPVTFQL